MGSNYLCDVMPESQRIASEKACQEFCVSGFKRVFCVSAKFANFGIFLTLKKESVCFYLGNKKPDDY